MGSRPWGQPCACPGGAGRRWRYLQGWGPLTWPAPIALNSASSHGILSVFETRPELSTSELARISQVTRQTMHTSILSLEASGLVQRHPSNQRVVLVRLTARGRKCLETATRRVREVEHAALADLSREDERTIRAWLVSMAAMTASPDKSVPSESESGG